LLFILKERKHLDVGGLNTVKLNSNGSLARLKIRLIAEGYFHVYGINYWDTSLVAKLTFVRILVSLAAIITTPNQVDVKYIFS